jgi:hypothetical protein
MPIDYKKYPQNWKSEIRPAILERAENKCEFCGVENYSVGFRKAIGGDFVAFKANGKISSYKQAFQIAKDLNALLYDKHIIIVLTIAHLDHDVANNDYGNLRALCQRCHNRHDIEFRKANRKKNENKNRGHWQ